MVGAGGGGQTGAGRGHGAEAGHHRGEGDSEQPPLEAVLTGSGGAEPFAALARTFDLLAPALRGLADPWWVVGGAALALHGIEVEPRDVDLLVSHGDARRLAAALSIAVAPGSADGRFRSDLFGRWTGAPLAVELFAGLRVRTAAGWTLVVPRTRERLGGVHVPSPGELRDMLLLFDRPKDHARIALLDRAG